MKTHAIVVDQPGGPEVLQWREVDVGEPGPGQVRLSQKAVGLNFIDVYHRTGLYPQPLPFIPGSEGAGIVDAVGSDVTDFKVGDRAAYAGVIGAYAGHRLIDASKLVHLPDAIAFDTAAAMMLKGMTADMLLNRVRETKVGDTILIHAAAGGVGLIMCQWASAMGASVIGTVSTQTKADLAAANGCDHPVLTGQQDFVAEVERITQGRKLPVVYDSVGKDTFLKSLDCLHPRGLMVSFGQSSGAIPPFEPGVLAQKGSLYLTRPTMMTYTAAPQDLALSAGALFAAVESGKVTIDIGQRFALVDAAEAHRALESRKTTGSTVLNIAA